MLVIHLLAGVVLGLVAALWGWTAGYSLWVLPGLYILGGSVGVIGSALPALLRSRASMQSEPLGLSQGA